MSWKARIEWLIVDDAFSGVSVVFGAQTLSGSGSTVVSTTPAPVFRGRPRGGARVTVLSGAVLAAIDDTTPVEADSVRLASGQEPLQFSLSAGQVISFVEAADAASAGATPVQFVDPTGALIDTGQASKVAFSDNVLFGVYTAALGNDVIGPFETTGYGSFIAEVQQLSAGSLRVETSVDGVNRWTDLPSYNVDQIASPGWSAVITSTAKYRIPTGAKWFRIRKISDGAAQVAISGSQFSAPAAVIPGGTLAFTETTANLPGTASAPSNTFKGTRRNTGATQGGPGTRWRTFNARARCSHAALLEIYESLDAGSTWLSAGSIVVPADTTTLLSVAVLAPDYQVWLTNTTATVQTYSRVVSGFQA